METFPNDKPAERKENPKNDELDLMIIAAEPERGAMDIYERESRNVANLTHAVHAQRQNGLQVVVCNPLKNKGKNG